MADQDREQGGRGRSRQGGQRDGAGGFRIRLSDNELQAARTLQEAFQLRSTVAVLGFSLRTMADLLEQGALDEVISQQKRSGGGRPPRGERRGGDGQGQRGARPNPFAVPASPRLLSPNPNPQLKSPLLLQRWRQHRIPLTQARRPALKPPPRPPAPKRRPDGKTQGAVGRSAHRVFASR